jgi:HPt (histidine-containing phosphotransfer) domain-containing protein
MSEPHVDLSFFKLLAIVPSPAEAQALTTALTALGTPFKIAVSADEAIQLLNGERFDLALVTDAAQVQTIRNAEASFKNMPVLIFADDGMATVGNANGVIPKPTETTAFAQTLQMWADQIFAALPVLEESSIDKIRMFDDEENSLLTSLFQIYSESTRDELREMETLVQQQDFPLLRKKAHKLKSSAAQLGAFRFEKYCTLMEYDPSLNQARAQKLYEEMSAEYQKSLTQFNQYCQKHAGL